MTMHCYTASTQAQLDYAVQHVDEFYAKGVQAVVYHALLYQPPPDVYDDSSKYGKPWITPVNPADESATPYHGYANYDMIEAANTIFQNKDISTYCYMHPGYYCDRCNDLHVPRQDRLYRAYRWLRMMRERLVNSLFCDGVRCNDTNVEWFAQNATELCSYSPIWHLSVEAAGQAPWPSWMGAIRGAALIGEQLLSLRPDGLLDLDRLAYTTRPNWNWLIKCGHIVGNDSVAREKRRQQVVELATNGFGVWLDDETFGYLP